MPKPAPLDHRTTIRPATPADAARLEHWDSQPHVIRATSDDAGQAVAFDVDWRDALAHPTPHSRYWIGEHDGRPVGCLLIIDPHLEPTRYWGDIAPDQRAIDIWIGEAGDLGRGHGEAMMRRALQHCFADPAVTGVVIDPLASNVRAQQFYRRLGFEPIERRRFGDDDCLVHRLTRAEWQRRFPGDRD